MTLDEFFAEAKRLNLTAADLVPGLTMRPEFDDCLSDNFRSAKAAITAMPEATLREFAIAQLIQLRFHEKYGNAMQNANAALRAEQGACGVVGPDDSATVQQINPPDAGPMPSICEGMEKPDLWAYAHLCGWRASGVAPSDERQKFEAAMGEALKADQGEYALSRAHLPGQPYTFLATKWAWSAWQRARGVALPLEGRDG